MAHFVPYLDAFRDKGGKDDDRQNSSNDGDGGDSDDCGRADDQ
jgi:hypothetical protein